MRQHHQIRGIDAKVRIDLEGPLTAFSWLFIKLPISIITTLKASMIVALMSMGLPSCGFTSVYGEGSSAPETLENVMLEDPTSRNEQLFLMAVEQRLPRPSNPKYKVKYRIELSYTGANEIGVQNVQIFGRVVSKFVDQNTSAVKFTFNVESFTSYSNDIGSNLQQIERKNAEERLMQILADKFITRLMIQSQMLGANEG